MRKAPYTIAPTAKSPKNHPRACVHESNLFRTHDSISASHGSTKSLSLRHHSSSLAIDPPLYLQSTAPTNSGRRRKENSTRKTAIYIFFIIF